MKALVFKDVNQLEIQAKNMPNIQKETDIIVKLNMASICTSDVHIKHGMIQKAQKGVALGHEFVGTVYQIGNAITEMHIGDRVAGSCVSFCGECWYCQKQYFNNCENGGWLLGCQIDGALAEYVRIPFGDHSLTKIPSGLSFKQTLLVGDILASGYFGCQMASIQSVDTVTIIGAGPVGLCAAQCAKSVFNAKRVIVIDIDQQRLDFCTNHGWCDCVVKFDNYEQVKNQFLRINDSRLSDCVIECAGGETTFQLAIELARPEACVAIVAMYDTAQKLDLPLYYGKNLTLRFGGVNSGYSKQIMELIETGKIDTSPIITKEFRFPDVMAAFDQFEHKTEFALKYAINFD